MLWTLDSEQLSGTALRLRLLVYRSVIDNTCTLAGAGHYYAPRLRPVGVPGVGVPGVLRGVCHLRATPVFALRDHLLLGFLTLLESGVKSKRDKRREVSLRKNFKNREISFLTRIFGRMTPIGIFFYFFSNIVHKCPI